jgi:EpsI family protein
LFGVVLGGFAFAILWGSKTEPPQDLDVHLSEGLDGWRLSEHAASDWRPIFVGTQGEAFATYERDDSRVDVYVGVYAAQSDGRELINGKNRLLGDGFNTLEPHVSAKVGGSLGRLRSVDQVEGIDGHGRKRLVWSWYAIGDRLVAGDVSAKLRQAIQGIVGRDSGAVIAVSALCPSECDLVLAELSSFVASMGAELSAEAIRRQSIEPQNDKQSYKAGGPVG